MRWTLESPVHNERCTPGLGTREMETAEGNPGTASSPYFHLQMKAEAAVEVGLEVGLEEAGDA